MGYCQNLPTEGVPPASLDCYITALTLGSDYDVMAKAVNSQNVWGPSAAAVENPIDAQSFERPTSPEPLEAAPNRPTSHWNPVARLRHRRRSASRHHAHRWQRAPSRTCGYGQ